MKNLQIFIRCFIVCISFTAVVSLSSCEKANQKRTYTEVVALQEQKSDETTSQAIRDPHELLKEMMARGEDPHAFMKAPPRNEDRVSLRGGTFFSDDEVLRQAQDGEQSRTTIHSKKIASSRLENVGTRNDTSVPLTWNVPSGWKEKPAGGMRLASFTSEMDPGLDVSIVSLTGEAGGVSANINRWLGQLHLPAFDDETLQPFLSKQENFTSDGGLLVTMVDFSTLLPKDDPSLPGMLAAIIQLSDQTVFVKMTGTGREINKNRELFKDLCRSVSR